MSGDMAHRWGFKNFFIYDTGVMYWAKKHPERSEFFGEKLTSQTAKTVFITDEQFNAVLLPAKEFIEKAKSGKYTVIDSRDFDEKKQFPIELNKLRMMSVDIMGTLLFKKSWMMPNRDLLIMDNSTTQVRWLHYYLEKVKAENYFFLKGGVRQWIADGYDQKGNKK